MSHSRSQVIAALAILLLAPAVRAADVELKAGGKITASKVTFYANTSQFTLNAGGTTLRYPASEIKSLVVDESRLGSVADRLKAAEKQATDATLLNTKTAEQLAQAKKANADLQQENQKLAAAVAASDDKSATLSDQVRLLSQQVSDLKARNERLGQISAAQQPAQTPARIEKPAVGKITWKAAREAGFIEVKGTCINTSRVAYRDTIIEISAVDPQGNLLATVATSVSDFSPGESRNFSTDLEVDAAKVGTVEAVVGETFPK